ncbi:MAG: TonB family protein [Deltaproteobacteria bacterium]|nr:TonB family protein [Deltaproteobacteria bacterium]
MTKENAFYRMLIFSVLLHTIFIVALSISFKKNVPKIDFLSVYSVSLVGSIEHQSVQENVKKDSEKTVYHGKEIKKNGKRVGKKGSIVEIAKNTKGEKSLSKKKVDYVSTTREELLSLQERIKELKAKTPYLEVSHKEKGNIESESISGFLGKSSAHTTSIDPVTQAYIAEILNKVKKAWGIPGGLATRRDLETIVIIKIRRDGRIVDMEVEKRSGNRLYDESVMRTLRTIDPLPPFPHAISNDYLEIGFRFLPGELS